MCVMTLYPYVYEGLCWVFDDSVTCLKEEAFVLGASEMISALVEAKGIPDAERGFALLFSDRPFDYDVKLHRLTSEQAAGAMEQPLNTLPATGNWYSGTIAEKQMTAWLCPALYEYFETAPETIYVKAEKLPEGVDPLWHVTGDTGFRRYMSAEPRSL